MANKFFTKFGIAEPIGSQDEDDLSVDPIEEDVMMPDNMPRACAPRNPVKVSESVPVPAQPAPEMVVPEVREETIPEEVKISEGLDSNDSLPEISTDPVDDPSLASSIGKQCAFEGNLAVAGRLFVSGSVTGDISAQGDVVIDGGTIKGNVTARSVLLSDNACVAGNIMVLNHDKSGMVTLRESKVEGNISCVNLDVGKDCEIVGNVEVSCDAVVDGKITGESLTADGSMKILSQANIESNITAPKIAVDDGAALNGKITMGIKAK